MAEQVLTLLTKQTYIFIFFLLFLMSHSDDCLCVHSRYIFVVYDAYLIKLGILIDQEAVPICYAKVSYLRRTHCFSCCCYCYCFPFPLIKFY